MIRKSICWFFNDIECKKYFYYCSKKCLLLLERFVHPYSSTHTNPLKNFQMKASGCILFGGHEWRPASILTIDTLLLFAQSVHIFSWMPRAIWFSSILLKLQWLNEIHESTVWGKLSKRPPYLKQSMRK